MASKAMLFDSIVSSLISLAHYPDDENHLIVFFLSKFFIKAPFF